MDTLATYEETSGQLINKEKSHFMVPSIAFRSTINKIKRVTNFNQKSDLITHLGYPL